MFRQDDGSSVLSLGDGKAEVASTVAKPCRIFRDFVAVA